MFEALPFVATAPGDEAMVTAIAGDAARHWGLPTPRLIRLSSNGIFSAGSTVLRVSRTTAAPVLSLQLASQLRKAGLNVSEPARDDVFGAGNGCTVTAWKRIVEPSGATVDWRAVGAMIRVLHGIDPAAVEHPLPFCGDFPWWNFELLLNEIEFVDAASGIALRGAYEARRWWYQAARTGHLVLCHGDVHPGNVLIASDGPVLIDWDLLCVGPAAWDHAPLMKWTSRWGGSTGIYQDFAAGYGVAVTDALGEAIAELRLLAATLMRLRASRQRPDNGEAQRRLLYWRDVPDPPMWTAV